MSIRSFITSEKKVYFDRNAHCAVSEQRYKTENLLPYKDYGVTLEFYNAFTQLPEKCSNSYYSFLTDWGTVRSGFIILIVNYFVAYYCQSNNGRTPCGTK